MVVECERRRVKALLAEAILALCKSSLSYQQEFRIEALIGITLDNEDIFLVNLNEQFQKLVEKSSLEHHDDCEIISSKRRRSRKNSSCTGLNTLISPTLSSDQWTDSPLAAKLRKVEENDPCWDSTALTAEHELSNTRSDKSALDSQEERKQDTQHSNIAGTHSEPIVIKEEDDSNDDEIYTHNAPYHDLSQNASYDPSQNSLPASQSGQTSECKYIIPVMPLNNPKSSEGVYEPSNLSIGLGSSLRPTFDRNVHKDNLVLVNFKSEGPFPVHQISNVHCGEGVGGASYESSSNPAPADFLPRSASVPHHPSLNTPSSQDQWETYDDEFHESTPEQDSDPDYVPSPITSAPPSPVDTSKGLPGYLVHQRRLIMPHRRERTTINMEQRKVLDAHFLHSQNPSADELDTLSRCTGLKRRVLQVWFQNTRAKYRRMMKALPEPQVASPAQNLNGLPVPSQQGTASLQGNAPAWNHEGLTSQQGTAPNHDGLILQQGIARNHDSLTLLQGNAPNHDGLTLQQGIARNHDSLTLQQGNAPNHDGLTLQQGIAQNLDGLTLQQGIARNHDSLASQQGTAPNHDGLTLQQGTARNHDCLTLQQGTARNNDILTSQEMMTPGHSTGSRI